ncbi:signal peptidase I [Oceanirhabdus sp. W0125-5]|uniref:signal peptidase I n=1 Tax=Oceanirhabdus sp. W0125-5 TaxID=2999116 RepID=UPI0022F329D9|nr:signal peptidase I [Oceanirhabdus sp. W0125-5]WBW99308.1 signal peptidase I [Oceanirhabdus sp. W0125-5]
MGKDRKSFIKYILFEWGVPIVGAYIVFLLLNRFVFFNIIVPTSSMEPTIMPNDRIMVTRIYNKDNIKRGDIIVFQSDELEEKLIKRVIGLPSDEVRITENGEVYINGEVIQEEYVKNQIRAKEIYPGLRVGVYKVPDDSFLFLGDNRRNSKDSRYWEDPYIGKDKILGKARVIIFPFKRIQTF